jgi:hypothetical protein
MEKEINPLGKMVTDTSLVNQPKGSTRFMLNAVNETEDGNVGARFTEESNEECYTIPAGFIPLGKVSVSNEESAVLLGNGVSSLIIVTKANCRQQIVFDDRLQTEKLGFKIENQIDVKFRLRKGCERTLYWVDPKPRYFNIDRPELFKNDLSEWNISSFDLLRRPKTYPIYTDFNVLSTGGSLLSGSYNFLIQHLDEDLNPSELVSPSETVKIYAESLATEYKKIRGSSNVSSAYYNIENTTKAIEIKVSQLDTSYPFYRVVIVEATSGTGLPTAVKYSNEISTSNPNFTYTGINFAQEGSLEEVLEIQDIIEEAGYLEQIDNMLVIGETKGSSIPFCSLQKYFSSIRTDMKTKTVFLSQLIGANSKNPLASIEGLGYMPKEIYSFGGVFLFENNIQSPVYHIPGKGPDVPEDFIYDYEEGVYAMAKDNECSTEFYIDNSSCEDFWGRDSEGNELTGEKIRHHRFPSRKKAGIPLIEEIDTDSVLNINQLNIRIEISGTLTLPDCPLEDPDCDIDALLESLEPIIFEVVYEDAEGNQYTFIDTISYIAWDEDGAIGYISFTPPISTDTLTLISITETFEGTSTNVTSGSPSAETSLSYTAVTQSFSSSVNTRFYKTEVMGLKFSNIRIPSLAETGGKKIIGVMFVRNERTEDQMTVVDTAVIVPTIENKGFIAQGLLCPELSGGSSDPRLNKKNFGFINPRFKFLGTTYNTLSSVERDGSFEIVERNKSRFRTEDIVDGTTYQKGKHKRSERDSDGWDLHVRTRHNRTKFTFSGEGVFASSEQIQDIYYLPALSSKLIEDEATVKKELFNLSSDNRIGIIQRTEEYTTPFLNQLPYVSLRVTNVNPYSNFRTLPYYKISPNYTGVIMGTTTSATVFGGDTFVSSMSYTNTVFYEDKARQRRTKSGALAIIGGVLLVALAVLVAIGTFGTGVIVSAALISAAAGLASTLLVSGIEQEAFNRAYRDLYNKGLRETVLDDYSTLFKVNPIDDEFQWIGDCADLWFESTINMGLRQGSNVSLIPDFINSPADIDTGNDTPLSATSTVPPVTQLDTHILAKLTYIDVERKKGGRGYFGYAQAEIYDLNLDYLRFNKQKAYFSLPLEYDCCSKCTEKFPHRLHYSLQSFDEELTDNYRVFLPNNYRDIEGNTGKITDVFRIGNNLYIHTQHALWHLPQNFQERITGEILSFIGTGEYFNLPPRKIVDDENNSAGTQHRWGRVKTPYGVAFPSSIEGKWFLFSGEKLTPLSDAGMSNDFRKLMQFKAEKEYTLLQSKPYPYSNNPSNPIGVGYVSVYDTEKNRLILSKKDFSLGGLIEEGDEICNSAGTIIKFEDVPQIIADREADGWVYVGIENCRLKFSRTTIAPVEIEGIGTTSVPNDSYVYVFPDNTGSFNATQKDELIVAVTDWYETFRPEDVGNTKLVIMTSHGSSERWVQFPKRVTEHATFNGKALVISLINEADTAYHGSSTAFPVSGGQPTANYTADRTDFIDNVYPLFDFFVGINYPIANLYLGNYNYSKAFIQHSLLSIKGSDYTPAEASLVPLNAVFTNPTEVTALYNSMYTNPYSALGPGLENYGWICKPDRNDLGVIAEDQDSIITPEQFNSDLSTILADVEATVPLFVPGFEETIEYEYEDGTPIAEDLEDLDNYSWTISYSLKEQGMISYHSWFPHFFLGETNRFYSWNAFAPSSLYKHNVLGSYLRFYGVYYPFIYEKVENQSPMGEKITDFVSWQTIAQVWDEVNEEYIELPKESFTKALFYNSYQISGILTLVNKVEDPNYFLQQIAQTFSSVIKDVNERTWTVNQIRDMRTDLTVPMFIKEVSQLQSNYFIDKIVNPASMSFNKPWDEMEPFRDKYLVVRYIFDNFDNIRLGVFFDTVDFKISER